MSLVLHYQHQFSSVSHVQLFVTSWTAACQASLSITNFWRLLKLTSIESVTPSNHLILCRPLLLHSIFPSIRVVSNESALRIRWPKYWSFSFNISPSNEYSGLISFRMDWLDLLAVQGTLKSLLCWGPEWGTPPMAKVMRKEAWHTQRCDQASGNPLFPSIYPQNHLWGSSPA